MLLLLQMVLLSFVFQINPTLHHFLHFPYQYTIPLQERFAKFSPFLNLSNIAIASLCFFRSISEHLILSANYFFFITPRHIYNATMLELNTARDIHNRIRLIIVSFLKDLHINWRRSERYLAKKLVYYDPVS